MLFDEFEIFRPTIESEYVACLLDDQVDQHAAIDEVIVDDEVVGVFDERPIHMCEPVDDHQQNTEASGDASPSGRLTATNRPPAHSSCPLF